VARLMVVSWSNSVRTLNPLASRSWRETICFWSFFAARYGQTRLGREVFHRLLRVEGFMSVLNQLYMASGELHDIEVEDKMMQ
jgi:hypothetical protein